MNSLFFCMLNCVFMQMCICVSTHSHVSKCVHIYKHVFTCVHMYTWRLSCDLCVYAYINKRLMLGIHLYYHSTWFWHQAFLTEPRTFCFDQTDWPLSSNNHPVFCLPHQWIYKFTKLHLAFIWVFGSKLVSSYFSSKYFIQWYVS